MNITIKHGNLLDSEMQTHVNAVNCVGVMGKGIALDFKKRYYNMFLDYRTKCALKQVRLGEPYIYQSKEQKIVNFPTKGHWCQSSKYVDVEDGLMYLAKHVEEWDITSIAMPLLGCGFGGLNYETILSLIIKHMNPLNIPIELYVSKTK